MKLRVGWRSHRARPNNVSARFLLPHCSDGGYPDTTIVLTFLTQTACNATLPLSPTLAQSAVGHTAATAAIACCCYIS